MAEARVLKQREYGNDILSHTEKNVVDYNRKTRYNNNMRSSAFHNEPDHAKAQRVTSNRRAYLEDKPCTTGAARASYQDSNIFGYKDAASETVQKSANSA